jgi:hypothetical protein
MRLNPIRRSQLISPFGPGAMHVLQGGVAVVTGGLDNWFQDRNGNATSQEAIVASPLYVREPRLEAQLGVSHFRLAPGPENRADSEAPELLTPVYRFPTWFVCPVCNRMTRGHLHTDGHMTCAGDKCRKARLRQISFASVCDHGHLQDFPWVEWVHRGSPPSSNCLVSLFYEAEGSGSLDDIKIRCAACAVKPRSLQNVMQGDLVPSKSYPAGWSGLSRYLFNKTDDAEAAQEFLCQGHRPWLGETEPQTACTRPLRAVLINSTNVHHADVRSAIHVPARYRPTASDLAKILDEASFRSMISVCRRADDEVADIIKKLRRRDPQGRLKNFTDVQLIQALAGHDEAPPADQPAPSQGPNRAEQELALRRDEYDAFSGETDRDGRLILRHMKCESLPATLKGFVTEVVAVEKLRETRVFAGFSRLLGMPGPGAPPAQSMLWRQIPNPASLRWLPAAVVHGEGIFIKFNEKLLAAWESKHEVVERVKILQSNHNSCVVRYNWEPMEISPRFVLLHTLSHLLINRMVFECGYGSSSLRERLYVSNDPGAPMAGMLIYTAAGDSEGTMGGLVKLAEPETLGELMLNALGEANWCSADPLCREAASSGGQGPDSLNLAACHSCALLPETSCEHFNKYLDRMILVDPDLSIIGNE